MRARSSVSPRPMIPSTLYELYPGVPQSCTQRDLRNCLIIPISCRTRRLRMESNGKHEWSVLPPLALALAVGLPRNPFHHTGRVADGALAVFSLGAPDGDWSPARSTDIMQVSISSSNHRPALVRKANSLACDFERILTLGKPVKTCRKRQPSNEVSPEQTLVSARRETARAVLQKGIREPCWILDTDI